MQASEADHIRSRSKNSITSTVYTMDPEAKYLTPKPSVRHRARGPLTKTSKNSRPPVYKYSTLATARSLPTMFSTVSRLAPPRKISSAEPCQRGSSASLPISRSSPLLVAFQKLRGTKSASRSGQQEFGHGSESPPEGKAKNRSVENLSGLQRGKTFFKPAWAKPVVFNNSPLKHTVRPQLMETEAALATSLDPVAPSLFAAEAQVCIPTRGSHSPLEEVPYNASGDSFGAQHAERPLGLESPYYTPLERLQEHNSFFSETTANCWNQTPSSVEPDKPDRPDRVSDDRSSIHPLFRQQWGCFDDPPLLNYGTAPEPHSDGSFPSETSFLDDGSEYGSQSQERSTSSLESAHEIFSPDLAASTVQTGTMSPYHLSQPLSPLRSDFEEDLLRSRDGYSSEMFSKNTTSNFDKLHVQPQSEQSPITSHGTLYRSSGGFEGYSLPEDEQSSVLTLRNLTDSTFKSSNGDSLLSPHGSKHLVHSWNDGSKHRINMTALDELVEDLGYLGEIIV